MLQLVRVDIKEIEPNPENVLNRERKDVSELIRSMQSIGYDPAYPAKAIKIGDKYRLITGNRRYLAAKKVTGFMYLILERVNEEQSFLEMVRENILRKNYDPIQEAVIFNQMKEKFGYSDAKVADTICISESYVRQRRKLLLLPKTVQNQVMDGKLGTRTAEYLAELENDEVKGKLAQEIINTGMDQDEARRKVELLKKVKDPNQQLKLIQSKFEKTSLYENVKKEKKEKKRGNKNER